MERKTWSELSDAQKAAVVIGGTVEVILTAVALTDLARRPAAGVRGPKVLWAVGCLIQPVGPIAYLAVGRRPGVTRVDANGDTAPKWVTP